MENKKIPAEWLSILSPEEVAFTNRALEASVVDITEKGQARTKAYGNKADLVKRRAQLETQIKIAEATALMMNVSPDGKKGEWNGSTFPLSNGEQRDAFQKLVSAELRKELSGVESEIVSTEVAQATAREDWEAAIQASESVRAKANLQARLLQWLAGGQ